MIGLYKNGEKFDSIVSQEHVSEALVEVLDELNNKFNIQKIIYANTPGSFMGLKVAYVILKTFSIVKGCEFYAVSGFDLNDNAPIKANKFLSFVNSVDGVSLQKTKPKEFKLPLNLYSLKLNSDTLPNYVIQAV
ncbi:glycoprotease [Campylobacter sp. faydin G-24]|uniref:Glycoprotease n=2 Tax=Campylobacter anatolicus TaxID=2829105 RepID=A0ABS5HJ61_9BACT|nr:glycoprotease [Campylobacter anatolicus]MBR8461906.1 glycoprotease [Campylobacter anatolicus]MBR8464303.1 glycoprotease [Campylobacter anatolicus]MBR8465003.1 glycoprotease [Campylobacter anatolicus]